MSDETDIVDRLLGTDDNLPEGWTHRLLCDAVRDIMRLRDDRDRWRARAEKAEAELRAVGMRHSEAAQQLVDQREALAAAMSEAIATLADPCFPRDSAADAAQDILETALANKLTPAKGA